MPSPSNPNTVTVINNTGMTISTLALGHFAGVSFAPPLGSDPVISVTNFANGATSPSGTADVADGLADFWLMGLAFEGSTQNLILIASGIPVPYKKCDTPDNGSTTFTLGSFDGVAVSVEIDTFNQDGSSDGTCSASMIDSSLLDMGWEEVLDIIIDWLGDGEDAQPALRVQGEV